VEGIRRASKLAEVMPLVEELCRGGAGGGGGGGGGVGIMDEVIIDGKGALLDGGCQALRREAKGEGLKDGKEEEAFFIAEAAIRELSVAVAGGGDRTFKGAVSFVDNADEF